ncbi:MULTISPECIES: 5'/3'-nucleotidase SurE [Chromobacterium]|uniref:5'-nucleotidase SurE n=2 Tax=Chromobacterium TaxID=535 RepID=A0A1W0CSQ1_9NEIS|nr:MULTISPECIES: 5'/3'-nucleotidase SurE [Chromobacterium]AXT45334.1 5'/3'-nucleotidase SurE [Chromobacterium rhizoryzae]MBK0416078.1 5'/3'-nucleotidase SurE [Chromobacterium haemolyticum]MBO0416949.1 5'/3'-nucleotidase SurE [Chromobacterium haemolyticum]MBO0500465.1 5'/3'-nucleotidase SurE [Chromobacterium haemolyticum]MDH0341589.1 5'/3'-nucleotidase SurE [Chromobacterium haemolyticum]
MKFLISNDDGYFAPGLAMLAQTLSRHGEVVIVAPERDRSGASNSLTLDRPLTVRKAANGFHYVNGTPTDCVHLAVTGMLDFKPDMVFSGINHGPNMGDDTLYSGTVAAATEGFMLGIPSIAVSLAGYSGQHFASAGLVVDQLVERCKRTPFREPVLLNVNVPDIAPEALGQLTVTRLGRRHCAQPVIKSQNPRGETIYWVGPVGNVQDAGAGTDFGALANNDISVTPLMLDLTAYGQLDGIKTWLHHS